MEIIPTGPPSIDVEELEEKANQLAGELREDRRQDILGFLMGQNTKNGESFVFEDGLCSSNSVPIWTWRRIPFPENSARFFDAQVEACKDIMVVAKGNQRKATSNAPTHSVV